MSVPLHYTYGQEVGKCIFIEDYPHKKIIAGIPQRQAVFKCRYCGNDFISIIQYAKKGDVVSCGCRRVKHGMTYSGEHIVWCQIKARCYNPKHIFYKHYGGRGILMCERWLGENGFQNFYDDMGTRPSKKHSIDRIDCNEGYFQNNCRWATQTQQARNRRDTLYITYKEVRLPLVEWAELLNISFYALYFRLYKSKWEIEKALFKPSQSDRRKS